MGLRASTRWSPARSSSDQASALSARRSRSGRMSTARRLLGAAENDELMARSLLPIEGVTDAGIGFHCQSLPLQIQHVTVKDS